MVNFVLGFVIGAIIGGVIAIIIGHLRSRQMRDAFTALAGEALDSNSRKLTDQAAATLEGKKALIDQALKTVNERLGEVRKYVQTVESQRKEEFGRLSNSVGSLNVTTGELHKVFFSTQRRGAWGERMAEDILRLAGLQNGVNYSKQSTQHAENGRPDFTFFLPNELKCNMDVKFPLKSYSAYLDAERKEDRDLHLKSLIATVRSQVRSINGREYINPKLGTVDYVILFIPSEQIFSLVLESQPDLIDESLQKKVVLASPLTLYAMLVVIRQAAENANTMKAINEILDQINEFRKQWTNYNIELDKLGQRIDSAAKQFSHVQTTRTNVLQKPLDKIEDLRSSKGLPEADEIEAS